MKRSLLVFAVCVPLALFIGYILATPDSTRTRAVVGLVIVALATPLLLKWHHPVLIATWNTTMLIPFLPGQPPIWVLVAIVSLGLSVLLRTMRKDFRFIYIPSVAWPLALLGAIILLTAFITGGFGGRSLGQEQWGAKRYLGVVGAIIGYFAVTALRVPPEKARLYAALFVVGGVTSAISDLAYAAGPRLYILFQYFPVELAAHQVWSTNELWRLSGVALACQSVCWLFLLQYGVRGIVDLRYPWRGLLFGLSLAVALTGGFRSTLILFLIMFTVQFALEGLFRTKLVIPFVLGGTLAAALVVTFADHLPLPVQRSLSFLPIDIDPVARRDAEGTLEWRLQMWKVVMPEVPQYLLIGKGFSYSGTDYYLTQEAVRRGKFTSFEDSLISGNYHNGFLTLIVPFGIWGFLTFAWFCVAALWVMIRNWRYGPERLIRVNTFLLTGFVSQLIFYVVFYGQFDLDLFRFTGLVGLSIALNGGVCEQPAEAPARAPAQLEPESAPVPAGA